jgi:hypothetical protein
MPVAAPWAVLGLFASVWKLAALAGAVAVFVWRTGLWRHPLWRFVRPWTAAPREPRAARRAPNDPPPPAAPRGLWARIAGDRWYLLLAITMALTLLAWVLARMAIHASAG